MKILYIHNEYGALSGEEHASRELVALLEEHGHEVKWFIRSSEEITNVWGKIKAFFTGIYNPFSAKKLAKVLDEYEPDVVQVQNLYPFLSVSIFKPLRKRNIPVVMRCPNYRLFCPSGLCINSKGEVCEACWSGNYEWNCIKNNCEYSYFKSIGYAIRNFYSRKKKAKLNGVNVFIVQSEFQKKKFTSMGITEDRIRIVAGILPTIHAKNDEPLGDWVTFVGRASAEKGIYEFIETARRIPQYLFKVVGKVSEDLVLPADLPTNLEFVGFKSGEALNEMYQKSRMIVVPSKWYEGFPNILLHAMYMHRPCITTNIGAMQSIVEDGIDGLLIEPGSVESMVTAILNLYPNIDICKRMGKNGFKKVTTEYSRESIYDALMDCYGRAKELIQNR